MKVDEALLSKLEELSDSSTPDLIEEIRRLRMELSSKTKRYWVHENGNLYYQCLICGDAYEHLSEYDRCPGCADGSAAEYRRRLSEF